MKYLTKSGNWCFVHNLLSYLRAFKLNDCWSKRGPFSLKGFLEDFSRQKWRDLISMYHTDKYDKIYKRNSLEKFQVSVV